MATFTVDGIRLYAREEGPRNGQLALLIHGWSSSWYAMSPLLPLLSRRFRCIAVDLPGYGNTPRFQERTTIPRYADFLAHLIRDEYNGPAVLIGHSMGGMISLTMAMRHPELVERMVLICPTISGKLSTYINLFVSPITMIERSPIANAALATLDPYMVTVTDRLMRPASFAERTAISESDYMRLRADARRPGQGRVRAECYSAMRANDLRGRLSAIETPSLAVWGAEDNTVPLRDAGVVADELRSTDLRIVPKAGHWPQFERPDLTLKMIASYLGIPAVTSRLEDSTSPQEQVGRIAEFFAHSDVGSNLNLAQRTRLAAQFRQRAYPARATIAQVNEHTSDLIVVESGSVEIWSEPSDDGSQRRYATLAPGQLTGEMALLDGGRRSAELRAGPDGASVLMLRRDRLVALAQDDPELGNAVIWNIAAALALRLRLANMQQQILVSTIEAMGDSVSR
jgi:pimeloyl-ACP methyl ester carboxylesterase/CRP-like cAMP-binding protein